MDCKNMKLVMNNKEISLLQGDEIFFNKIISRDSSMGFSSRIYYRPAEGVPFEWETKPGTPINPHVNGPLPPLSPPPGSLQSPFKAHPCNKRPKSSFKSKLMFWKKSKKSEKEAGRDVCGSGRVEEFGFWGSDNDSVSSPSRDSRSSSSSSSSRSVSSFDGGSSPAPSSARRKADEGLAWTPSCTTWSFTGFVTSKPRRI